jgi:hypothetical protein
MKLEDELDKEISTPIDVNSSERANIDVLNLVEPGNFNIFRLNANSDIIVFPNEDESDYAVNKQKFNKFDGGLIKDLNLRQAYRYQVFFVTRSNGNVEIHTRETPFSEWGKASRPFVISERMHDVYESMFQARPYQNREFVRKTTNELKSLNYSDNETKFRETRELLSQVLDATGFRGTIIDDVPQAWFTSPATDHPAFTIKVQLPGFERQEIDLVDSTNIRYKQFEKLGVDDATDLVEVTTNG